MNNDADLRIARLETACRRWRAASMFAGMLASFALFAAVVPAIIPRPPQPPPRAASFDQLTVSSLTVKFLRVVDDNGRPVVTLSEGAGGGSVFVESATPHDHSVMISADPYGADVQVSSQKKPRQYAHLKIMDRRPYLQMMEEGDDGHARNFYQAPSYAADGTIAGRARLPAKQSPDDE